MMVTVAAYSSPNDKEQFEYAGKWFEYHADQRLKMFNYMWIAFGLLANAIVAAINSGIFPVAAALCFVAAILALVFGLFDRRNQTLTWAGEDVLADLEEKWLFVPRLEMNSLHDKKRAVRRAIFLRLNATPHPTGFRGAMKSAWLGYHRFWIKATAVLMFIVFTVAFIVFTYLSISSPSRDHLKLTLDYLSTDKLQVAVEPANPATPTTPASSTSPKVATPPISAPQSSP